MPALKAEVKILNKDVGFVRTGQIASVQLDAFNYIKYGAIDGVVENIYQDSVEDEEMGYVFLASFLHRYQNKGTPRRLDDSRQTLRPGKKAAGQSRIQNRLSVSVDPQ
jgi:hypothetical protein